MMSPACGCQQSVRLERLLSEAAADSWPHSGLAEFLSIADVTRRSCDLHQRGDGDARAGGFEVLVGDDDVGALEVVQAVGMIVV
jgi:hypothetical protein